MTFSTYRQRARWRKRFIVPEIKAIEVARPPFEKYRIDTLITHHKMLDDIPESPEFSALVGTTTLNRSLSYSLQHNGEKWTIVPAWPTATSYTLSENVTVAANTVIEAVHIDGPGIFVFADVLLSGSSFKIQVLIDTATSPWYDFSLVLPYKLLNVPYGFIRFTVYDSLGNIYAARVEGGVKFKTSFIVKLWNVALWAQNVYKIEGLGQIYKVEW